ncbi:hypothetical protein RALTA_ACDS957195D [Cupriavidus taiwanensis LMG 19424]|uniref:Uncharacterized protein n=1 Tax=Cupriavidus taiwanensis (strain DSM 17343 / BCRC 17206 / CCUG 44338 / CIP 107171 / LMG 19424 / R1) TaxID=977880 RepID=B3R3M5_CUPTR|nr:hypothetical protein RALTA_ACDS957195D [Cupriavidus taiwanensis LMG 19424]
MPGKIVYVCPLAIKAHTRTSRLFRERCSSGVVRRTSEHDTTLKRTCTPAVGGDLHQQTALPLPYKGGAAFWERASYYLHQIRGAVTAVAVLGPGLCSQGLFIWRLRSSPRRGIRRFPEGVFNVGIKHFVRNAHLVL